MFAREIGGIEQFICNLVVVAVLDYSVGCCGSGPAAAAYEVIFVVVVFIGAKRCARFEAVY